MTHKQFKEGDWVCEEGFNPEYDDIYQIKDVALDVGTGEWLFSLDGHHYNGSSDFNSTNDWYWTKDVLEYAPYNIVRIKENTTMTKFWFTIFSVFMLTAICACFFIAEIPDFWLHDSFMSLAFFLSVIYAILAIIFTMPKGSY